MKVRLSMTALLVALTTGCDSSNVRRVGAVSGSRVTVISVDGHDYVVVSDRGGITHAASCVCNGKGGAL